MGEQAAARCRQGGGLPEICNRLGVPLSIRFRLGTVRAGSSGGPIRTLPWNGLRIFTKGEARMKTISKHYIDGEFVESHGGEVMDIIKPTNGQVIGRVTLADEEDTRRAISAAKRAFDGFGRSTKEERVEMLRQLHHAASARLDDLTAAMVEEYGGVVRFAGLIVKSGIDAFLAAEQALKEIPLTR